MVAKSAPHAEALRSDFHQLYGCGRDFEGATLIEVLKRVGGLVSDIVGREPADAGFAALTRALGYEVRSDATWTDALDDQASGDAYCWPMGAVLHDLNAYAYYGVALNGGRTADEREEMLRSQIEIASKFMAGVPFEAWGIDPGDAGRTLRRARARFALDTDQPIEADDLALLGDVTVGRIRNLMAGRDRVFTSDNGRVPAAEANAWLVNRGEVYRPSCWRTQNTFEDLAAGPVLVEDAVFVPVAADGSTFHPGLVRDGVYIVGRGKGEPHPTFESALAALQKLADPAWPRQVGRGAWTTVSAVRWARMSRAELDQIANAN